MECINQSWVVLEFNEREEVCQVDKFDVWKWKVVCVRSVVIRS